MITCEEIEVYPKYKKQNGFYIGSPLDVAVVKNDDTPIYYVVPVAYNYGDDLGVTVMGVEQFLASYALDKNEGS